MSVELMKSRLVTAILKINSHALSCSGFWSYVALICYMRVSLWFSNALFEWKWRHLPWVTHSNTKSPLSSNRCFLWPSVSRLIGKKFYNSLSGSFFWVTETISWKIRYVHYTFIYKLILINLWDIFWLYGVLMLCLPFPHMVVGLGTSHPSSINAYLKTDQNFHF